MVGYRPVLAEGTVVLEKYNEALGTRDMLETVQISIKWHGEQFKIHYDSLLAAIAMRDLQISWKAKKWAAWCRKFMCAVDELNAQYLRVREARQELFRRDTLNELGTDIDTNNPVVLIDEKVNWGQEELVLCPRRASEY
jgi:hypothetical protein